MKLLLCSGRMIRDGWTRIDSDPAVNPDILWSLPPLPPQVLPQSVRNVELIHGIEHFFPWEAEELLKSILLALRPDGLLVLEQPNIEFAAEVLLGLRPPLESTASGQCDMWPLYGDPSHHNPLFMHKWGYTPASLTRLLVGVGFRQAEQKPARYHYPKRDFRVEARP